MTNVSALSRTVVSGALTPGPRVLRRRWADISRGCIHTVNIRRRVVAGAGDDVRGDSSDVYHMRAQQSAQQNLADEVASGVADIMDIDRTAELLIYLWQHLWRRKPSKAQEQLETHQTEQAQEQYLADAGAEPAALPVVSCASTTVAADAELAGPPPGVPAPAPPGLEVATLAGGCFWGLEACLQNCMGVVSLESGYAGGSIIQPTYKQVCAGNTGHAEVVRVTYDPALLSYERLLHLFFSAHDPTTFNRQGSDAGSQYRSMVCCHSTQQQQAAQHVMWRLQAELVRARQLQASGARVLPPGGRRIAGAAAVLGMEEAGVVDSAAAAATAEAAAGASPVQGMPLPLLQRVPAWEQDVVVTEVLPDGSWQYWPAEQYHRSFFRLNRGQGYCMRIIAPRLARFRDAWAGHGLLAEHGDE